MSHSSPPVDLVATEETDRAQAALERESGPAVVGHVADFCHRYPGEIVTLYTRVDILETASDLTLRISLPEGLELEDYRPPEALADAMPYVEVGREARYLAWSLAGEQPAGTRYEYWATARLASTPYDRRLTSRAALTTPDQVVLGEESLTVAVWTRGRYMHFLPEIYHRDELMGRFLMLFESFWAPIDTQVRNVHNYFDPRLTPSSFLPWLASWLDLKLDESWPEKRLRQLVRWAIALHRSRGTKWGLLKYLEIYTGQRATITEFRSKNFVLGEDARLGPSIALGRGNKPHTFTVRLRLPPIEAEEEAERQRREHLRRRTIESIIEMQKPAHTLYTLILEPLEEEEPEAEAAESAPAESEPEIDEIEAQAATWFKLDE